jgi:hypothetical protein
MTDKTKIYEALGQFIDLVATEDDADQAIMKSVIGEKSKHVLEFTGDSQIKLDGDDVMVSGKKVGRVKIDHDDMASGIDFISVDGKFSKEFDDMESLYSFIATRFNVKEGTLDLSEGRVEDAVLKQPAMKSDRAKRWASVRKGQNKDGSMGDYEGGNEGKYKDPNMDKHGSEEGDGMKDKRHLKGYYDSTDVRKKHKDTVRGGSEAAHPGGASDIETDASYDSHDVRKQHN